MRDSERLAPLVRDAELLFNLVGQTSHLDSMREPLQDLEHNCATQLAVLEACRHENPDIRIVFAGTRQVYGRPRELPVSESHPIAPVDVNGIHKLAGEWYHLLYGQVYGLPRERLAADEYVRPPHARARLAADVPRHAGSGRY